MNNIPLRSRDIVDQFIRSGKDHAEVDTAPTGRSKVSVYNALLAYVKRNSHLSVAVRLVHGDIVLVNNEKYREDSVIC